MKTTKINVQLKNGNAVIREIELTPDDSDIILEALRYYFLGTEKIENDLMNSGCQRLRLQSFYLKNDIADILDKIKE